MIIIKTPKEIEIIKEGGRRLATILGKISKKVVPNINTKELDIYAEELIRSEGDTPSFLNYKPEKYGQAYPASLCVSINDEIVHGIPNKNTILKEGDIVSLDLGLKHQGFYTDMAVTVPVGKIDKRLKKLIQITKESLHLGILSAKSGNHVGDLGFVIQEFVEKNVFNVIRDLAGHGVGKKVHEDPLILNFGEKGEGTELKSGMVLALEPMVTLGSPEIVLSNDGFTYQTKDKQISAHFEHTIVITDNGSEILTKE